MENKKLTEGFEVIDYKPLVVLPKEYGPYSACLMDENEPNGIVEVKDCNGVARIWMIREDYDNMINNKTEHHNNRPVVKIKEEYIPIINEISEHVYGVSKDSGFHDNDEDLTKGRFGDFCTNLVGEIAELWEAYRKGKLNSQCDKPIPLTCAAEELADIMIRTMDTAFTLGVDLGTAIVVKDAYNQTRPYKHGDKKA